MTIKKNVIQTIVLCMLYLIFVVGFVLYIFSRSSVEVGEERFWLLDVIFIAFFTLAFLSIVFWRISAAFQVTLGLFVLGSCFALLLFSGCVSFADRINEQPKKYKSMLPITIHLEKSYLNIFRTELFRLDGHEKKASKWGDLIK